MSTVLVCDDSPLAREALRRAVATVAGVDRVVVAGSGEECLVRFSAERPDLVLVDVRMPGIGGVEAARRILGAAPRSAVIMMTMAEDVDGVARAVSSGARGYLVKDASREELTAMVTQALADVASRHVPRGFRRSPSASCRCCAAWAAAGATPRSARSSTCPRTP
jgi:DNA-binding NarL/FixJ family response regulator